VIACIVFTDGRTNLLRRTLASFETQVSGQIVERWIYDDSGDRRVREAIARNHPEFSLINHPSGERQGFAGAIRTAWDALRSESIADYVFHLEDDFTFNRPVNLDDFENILTKRPNLAQIALLRQAWNPDEIEAGGLIEMRPDEYVTHLDGDGRCWLEHDLFFTTNPSLYRRSLIEMFDWPAGPESEGRFGLELRKHGFRFAYWGSKDDEPAVHHIGSHRAGSLY
jgi:glycosyltransferase involved in cell wall biosynthesis